MALVSTHRQHEYRDLETEHSKSYCSSTVYVVVGTHSRERTIARKNKEQPFIYIFFADALHHILGICS